MWGDGDDKDFEGRGHQDQDQNLLRGDRRVTTLVYGVKDGHQGPQRNRRVREGTGLVVQREFLVHHTRRLRVSVL